MRKEKMIFLRIREKRQRPIDKEENKEAGFILVEVLITR
jgi:hypothetical protein